MEPSAQLDAARVALLAIHACGVAVVIGALVACIKIMVEIIRGEDDPD